MIIFGVIGCAANFGTDQLKTRGKYDRYERIEGMKNKYSNSPGPTVELGKDGHLVMTYPDEE